MVFTQISSYTSVVQKSLNKAQGNFSVAAGAPTFHSALLLLLPEPFRGMGAWRKTMEHQKPGKSPGLDPEVLERQRVVKE